MMIRNQFTEEQEQFRASFRRFLDAEVVPQRERFAREGLVGRDIYKKAGEQGFLLYWVEEEFGGLGIKDFRYEQIMWEETARCLESGLWIGPLSRNSPPYIANFGTQSQKQKHLPRLTRGDSLCAIAMTEPDAGSDIRGFKTRAEYKNGKWILNGSKTYISFGLTADLFVVAAKTSADDPKQVGLFLVEDSMPGFRRGRKLEKLGLLTQDTTELFFDNIELDEENIIGDPARGFEYMGEGLAEERLTTACQSLPWAAVAIDLTLDFVIERKAFGQRIADFQNTKFKLAEMRTEVDATQAFLDHCVRLHNAGELDAATASTIKLKTSEVQGKVMDECVQLHGSAGYMREYPICQLYADARIARIYAGTSEVMKIVIARDMLQHR
jgi:long-chain-acyl-CoA dehydrogenase